MSLLSTSNAQINNTFINALIQKESKGVNNAIGDNSRARGCLQIWEVVIIDVNRVYKTKYTHNDAFNRKLSIEICKKYLIYWGNVYKKKTNKEPTLEIYAKIWNGGPEGYNKSETLKYWKEILPLL